MGGVVFWGAFNTPWSSPTRRSFASPVMRCGPNVYEELTRNGSFLQPLGRPGRPVPMPLPHEWTDKIARKMPGLKEVWGKIFGTINTREKFLDHRLELAKHEWARLKAHDRPRVPQLSLFSSDGPFQADAACCRNPYALPAAGQGDLPSTAQGHRPRAPNMQGIEPGWKLHPNSKEETPAFCFRDRRAEAGHGRGSQRRARELRPLAPRHVAGASEVSQHGRRNAI